ncbi:protein FAR1-RELATED SEQUENCE 5-like [Rutidosis leptorrhynchoides]|uniref:protein FAR1-RELATED SEQUENCE 5-like n=1 Tax=Rutidosis leptorrhynchoides TaxID=125765 RepID=UPI003A994406
MESEREYDISDEYINEIQNDEDYNSPKATATRKNETPGGSLYYTPIVDKHFLPVIGHNYGTLDQCEEMYRLYAYHACFDIRKAGQKTAKSGLVKQKYYLCNKAGTPKEVYFDTLQETKKPIRKSNMECTGCRAKVRFNRVYETDTFILADFEEQHNHELLPIEYRHLSKKERKMRNWKRDLNVFINATNSQMLVNKMEERKKYVPDFSFEYKLEKSQLHSIFWADEVAKCNYNEFSDVISFDATYRTNRYNLKFVPFTGIDNHHRCVTVAAAMIRDETAESYKWLLNCFMKTFGKEPNMIVTDQDKSMAIAIKKVFKTAKHRLCMWHIMQKVPSNIQEANPNIEDKQEKDFKKRFDKIVWNMYIERTVFEEKWEKLMDDFSLKNDSWFKYMFDIRSSWIPAYFIKTEMFGLMRTTSRSESENAFFTLYKICIKSVDFYGRL